MAVNRDYICKGCAYQFEMFQPIADDYITICPTCGGGPVEQLFNFAPPVVFRDSPKTLGALADRNAEKMGSYEIEEKTEAKRQAKKEVIRQRNLRGLPEGVVPTELKTGEDAPWRPGTTGPNLKLNKLTDDQKTKYVHEGVLPCNLK